MSEAVVGHLRQAKTQMSATNQIHMRGVITLGSGCGVDIDCKLSGKFELTIGIEP